MAAELPLTEETGHALQIVLAENDHTFVLNEDALNSLLLSPQVRDRKVIVISVAGAYRKGKSFLLDFFLRYLNSKGALQWMGDPNVPLKGFPWKGGSERDTSGILMWNEPFDVTLPSGEKAVVLLMDTQGAFDSQSTVKDCATVFALSTLLSSVQIYNIMSNIQEDDLQHLQLFTEYGRLAMETAKTKPFQHLHFLVRDWSYPYDYEFGSVGGNQILEKRLQIVDGQHEELQRLRRHLRTCFKKIDGFLMPHPGLVVATSPKFDGRLKDIEESFKEHVQVFVSSLLATDNLVVKEINDSPITGKELVEYFKAYVKMYQGDELPEPKSMLQATAEANNLAAVAKSKDVYASEMEKICGGDKPYLMPAMLKSEHERCRATALQQFTSTRKMGGEEFSQEFLARLESEIDETFEGLVRHNAAKNVFAGLRTPGVLLVIAVALYLLSGILGTIGLESLANVVNAAMLIVIGTLGFWGYSRFSGKYTEIASQIDIVATAIHMYVQPESAAAFELPDKKKKQ